jgi:uncharacterized heparinase superfamily protein
MRIHFRRILHRLINPAIWRWYGRGKIERLSDVEFRKLFRFRQDLEGFVHDFDEAARLRFFFHPRNKKDFFLHLLLQSQPHEEILSDAQDVLANRFEAFGSDKVVLGESINWSRDFRSGKEWQLKRLSDAELLDVEHPSDIKIVWELNRFHQVWWLGKAYWATHSEEYARKFTELIDDWIQKNPVGYGPNWSISMEVAVRACNWIAGYYFFCESKSLSSEFRQRFLKSLYAHACYIDSHLEFARRNGNHLLADIVGILFLGVFFKSAPVGERWTRWAVQALQEEMETQVYADGVDYEKSIAYHRLVLELFYTATVLCQVNKISLGEPFLKRLEKMFEFVLAYTRADGSVPNVGDADDARLFQLSLREDFNDHRHALSVGAILFQRADFRTAAGKFAQDALWLFGGEGFEMHQRLQPSQEIPVSRAFADGGFFVMRSNEAHVFIDAGDIGMHGRGGHGHNDVFSFELWCDNHPFIVDSGTYTYSPDVKSRNEFRSTAAHNLLVVDGSEQADFTGLWSIREDETHPRVLDWVSSQDRDVLEAEHYAYLALPSRITHKRRFELNKSPLSLVITDALSGSGSHLIERYLHFAPQVSVTISGPQKAIARIENASYIISVNTGEISLHDAWYSRGYGVRERNKVLKVTINATLPAEFRISIQREPSA